MAIRVGPMVIEHFGDSIMLCTRCGKYIGKSTSLCNECQFELQSATSAVHKRPELPEDYEPEHSPSMTGSQVALQRVITDPTEILNLETMAEEGGHPSAGYQQVVQDPAGAMFRLLALLVDLPLIAFSAATCAKLFKIALQVNLPLPQYALPKAGTPITHYALNSGFETLFMVALGYYLLFEISPLRASPGKLLFDLSIRSPYGEKASAFRALFRTFNKAVCFVPILGCLVYLSDIPPMHEAVRIVLACTGATLVLLGLDFLFVLLTYRRQALHDLLSRTIVMQPNNLTFVDVFLRTVFAVVLAGIATWGVSLAGPKTGQQANAENASAEASIPAEVEAAEQPKPSAEKKLRPIASGSIGNAQAGKSRVFFKDAVVRYNKRYNNIEVALFNYKLSNQQKEKIAAADSMAAIGKGAPYLTLVLAFSRGGAKLSSANLTSYSAVFYQQKDSRFKLPEGKEKVVFSRSPRKLTKPEFVKVSGILDKQRSKIELSCGGVEISPDGTTWSWHIKLAGPILIPSE